VAQALTALRHMARYQSLGTLGRYVTEAGGGEALVAALHGPCSSNAEVQLAAVLLAEQLVSCATWQQQPQQRAQRLLQRLVRAGLYTALCSVPLGLLPSRELVQVVMQTRRQLWGALPRVQEARDCQGAGRSGACR
jgi:hypothetical protein